MLLDTVVLCALSCL